MNISKSLCPFVVKVAEAVDLFTTRNEHAASFWQWEEGQGEVKQQKHNFIVNIKNENKRRVTFLGPTGCIQSCSRHRGNTPAGWGWGLGCPSQTGTEKQQSGFNDTVNQFITKLLQAAKINYYSFLHLEKNDCKALANVTLL